MSEEPTPLVRRRVFTAGLALALVLGLLWYNRGPAVPVQAAQVRRAPLVVEVTTNGKVEPIDDIEVRARLDGRVIEIPDPGKRVEAGEVVVQFDAAPAGAALAAAESERLAAEDSLRAAQDVLAVARDRLAVDERLQRQGALTRERLTETRNAAREAEARLAVLEREVPLRVGSLDLRITELRAQREAATVRAPIAGTVYRTQAKKGEMVRLGDPLLWIADLERLRVRTNVDQVDLGRVQPGQDVRITANAFPGRTWTGAITEVTPYVVVKDQRSVSEALARVEPPTAGLVPGMTVDVEVVISDTRDVLQVAADAIVGDQRQPFVYRIDGSRIRRTPVRVGRSNTTDVEIVEGLDAGDLVVATPRPELVDGARVDVWELDGTAGS